MTPWFSTTATRLYLARVNRITQVIFIQTLKWHNAGLMEGTYPPLNHAKLCRPLKICWTVHSGFNGLQPFGFISKASSLERTNRLVVDEQLFPWRVPKGRQNQKVSFTLNSYSSCTLEQLHTACCKNVSGALLPVSMHCMHLQYVAKKLEIIKIKYSIIKKL